jgi:cytochrome c oxidase subunit 4
MATDTAPAADAHAGHDAHDAHDGHEEHWTDLSYIKLAIALAVVTALEVAMSYTIDFWGPLFIPVLLLLMVVKFMAVVLFFMHLKFDNRLFSLLFYMGLVLAIGVYVVALLTFRFFDG